MAFALRPFGHTFVLWQRTLALVQSLQLRHRSLRLGRDRKTFRWQTQLDQIVTFYSLNTIRPCSLDVFLEFVRSRGVSASDDGSSELLEFTDDTGSVYRIRLVDGRDAGYLYFDGTITVKPKQLQLSQINEFVQFCSAHDLGVRRGKIEVTGPGNLASDIFSSEAFRKASHLSSQMRDQT